MSTLSEAYPQAAKETCTYREYVINHQAGKNGGSPTLTREQWEAAGRPCS